MQQVTSTSHQVDINASQSVKNRFGFETNWKQVSNPSGGNAVSRTINAVIAVFVNFAKSLVNLTLWPLNKIHSLVFGRPTNTITIEDDIEIQQDTVTVDIAEATQADETIPEPVVVESNKNLQMAGKAALAVAAGLVAVAALSRGAQYFSATQNKVTGAIDNFIFGTVPTTISNGASSIASGATRGFCSATLGYVCKA